MKRIWRFLIHKEGGFTLQGVVFVLAVAYLLYIMTHPEYGVPH